MGRWPARWPRAQALDEIETVHKNRASMKDLQTLIPSKPTPSTTPRPLSASTSYRPSIWDTTALLAVRALLAFKSLSSPSSKNKRQAAAAAAAQEELDAEGAVGEHVHSAPARKAHVLARTSMDGFVGKAAQFRSVPNMASSPSASLSQLNLPGSAPSDPNALYLDSSWHSEVANGSHNKLKQVRAGRGSDGESGARPCAASTSAAPASQHSPHTSPLNAGPTFVVQCSLLYLAEARNLRITLRTPGDAGLDTSSVLTGLSSFLSETCPGCVPTQQARGAVGAMRLLHSTGCPERKPFLTLSSSQPPKTFCDYCFEKFTGLERALLRIDACVRVRFSVQLGCTGTVVGPKQKHCCACLVECRSRRRRRRPLSSSSG